jgi:hypothetical protein
MIRAGEPFLSTAIVLDVVQDVQAALWAEVSISRTPNLS